MLVVVHRHRTRHTGPWTSRNVPGHTTWSGQPPRLHSWSGRVQQGGGPLPTAHGIGLASYVPSSFLLLVARPGATGSVLAPSSDALCYYQGGKIPKVMAKFC